MNYKQIPFDINIAKDIVSGKVDGKIYTKDNHLVRISKSNLDLSPTYPIVGFVLGENGEIVTSWNRDGHNIKDNDLYDWDLIILIKEEQ